MCERAPTCDVQESPGASAAAALACTGNGVNETEIVSQQMREVRNPDTNPNTSEPGVYLHSVRSDDGRLQLVRVELSELEQMTIGELAEKVHLTPARVLHYILSWTSGPNQHVIRALYRRYIRGNDSAIEDQVFSLRDAKRGVSAERIPHFRRWRLPRGNNYRLFLPRSDAFEQRVVDERVVELSHTMNGLIETLDVALSRAGDLARTITDDSQRLAHLLNDYTQEASMIELMRQFLEIAEAQAAEPIDQAGYDQLQAKVGGLQTEAQSHFAFTPTETTRQLKQRIEANSTRLYRMLCDPNSDLVQAFAAVLERDEVVMPSYIRNACTTLGACCGVINMSSHADHFVQHDVMPLLSYLADRNSSEDRQSFFARFRNCLGAIAAYLDDVPNMVGNLPGPPSLLMVVVDTSVPVILRLGAQNPTVALEFRRAAGQCLLKWLGVAVDKQADFLAKLNTTDADELAAWRQRLVARSSRIVNSSVMDSPCWSVFMSIIHGFLFLNSLCELSTWNTASVSRRIQLVANASGGLSNVLLSVQTMLKHCDKVNQAAPALSQTWTNRLGLFAAIAVTVSSAASIYQEAETRDYTGTVIAVLSFGSGLLAIAGWLGCMGVVTAWAGIGEVLLVASLVVALIAGLWSFLRTETDVDSLFESFVQELKNKPKFQRFRTSRTAHGRALQARFAEVEAYHHHVTLEEMQAAAREALKSLFGYEQIQASDEREQMDELIDSLIA